LSLKACLFFFEQLLYPLKCIKCGVYIDPETIDDHSMNACFCSDCMATGFYPMTIPYCIKCGAKFHQNFNENHVCEACLKLPLKLDRVRAALEYKGIVKDAIPFFKYQSKLSLTKIFEQLLFQAFVKYFKTFEIDLVMPIPLHKEKLRQRGFNQAYLMVRNFNKLYEKYYHQIPQWKIDAISLARIKKTKPQTGFDTEQRKKNLENAFKVLKPKNIIRKNILLIDDVFTTGTTCNEAAMALLKNGAKKVEALVLARA